MESRIERVVLETDRSRVVGDLTLPREGYRSRLSDYLNRGDLDFVPLTNATVSSLGGAEQYERDFVAVARRHVHLAYPRRRGPRPRLRDELRPRRSGRRARLPGRARAGSRCRRRPTRPEHEALRHERPDLLRREVDDGDDATALELLARVVGDLRRRALRADLGAELDLELPRRLSGPPGTPRPRPPLRPASRRPRTAPS